MSKVLSEQIGFLISGARTLLKDGWKRGRGNLSALWFDNALACRACKESEAV